MRAAISPALSIGLVAALLGAWGCSAAALLVPGAVQASTQPGSVAGGAPSPGAKPPEIPPGSDLAKVCADNFAAWDTNHDGAITLDEYLANQKGKVFYVAAGAPSASTTATAPGTNPVSVASPPPPPSIQSPEAAFKQLDKNGDGKVTLDEMCAGIPGYPPASPSPSATPPTGGLGIIVPARAADVEGTLTKLVLPTGDTHGSALVEAQPGTQSGRKIQGGLDANTRVVDLRPGVATRAAIADLKEGQHVKLWIPEGSVCAMSYPEMCGTDTIEIVSDR